MTIRIIALLFFAITLCSAETFNVKEFQSRLNEKWKSQDVNGMKAVVENFRGKFADDPAFVASIFQFYVYVDQNYEKTQKLTKELLFFIDAHGNNDDKLLAHEILKMTLNIPKNEFKPYSKDQIAALHKSFPNYPFDIFANGIISRIQKRQGEQGAAANP